MIVYEVGDTVEGYQLRAKIGAGGMGVVYLAEQVGLKREVAFKLILLGHDDPSIRAMFVNEAQLGARLSHPNIVQVIDAGTTAQGLLYMSQVYVRGHDLRHVLERSNGGLPLPLAIFIVIQVLYALQHAHENGVVHRDVKPENILVGVSGQVQITDFGIAKALAHGVTPSISTALRGSVPYMAPEIIRMQPVGFNSDLWAVGVLLCELLTGRNPFMETAQDEREAILLKILSTEPDVAVVAGLLPGLDRIVTRLLRKNPAERYQTAAEVLDELFQVAAPVLSRATALALKQHLTALPTMAMPVPMPVTPSPAEATPLELRTSSMAGQMDGTPPPPRSVRRKQRRVVAATVTAVATAFIVVLALHFGTSTPRPEPAKPPVMAIATPAWDAPVPLAVVPDASVAAGTLALEANAPGARARLDGEPDELDLPSILTRPLGTSIRLSVTAPGHEPKTIEYTFARTEGRLVVELSPSATPRRSRHEKPGPTLSPAQPARSPFEVPVNR